MKRVFKLLSLAAFAVILLSQSSCTDRGAIIDEHNMIPDHDWTYLNKYNYTFKIDDEKSAYNVYMNLRVTSSYKYSNMFVLITQTAPDKKSKIKRYELKLANKAGEWLGTGSGNLYNYQLSFLTNYKFPVKGNYTFTIEQNMRDNPLHEVSDVGLRVEKVQ
jgi:gliding motility-associated lipoprotein GldH